LESIEIPGSVSSIDGSAFAGIPLNSVSVSTDNMRFRVRECFLEDCDGSTVYLCFGSFRSVVIPSSIVVLGKKSFYEFESLESVTFESGSRLERIEESAFRGSGLKSILIPSSVVVLGKESFVWCKSLESVTFESGSRLERIDQSMFERSGVSFEMVSRELTRSKRTRGQRSTGFGGTVKSRGHYFEGPSDRKLIPKTQDHSISEYSTFF
jgi:hypothetical protein